MRTLAGTWRITVPQGEGNPEQFEALHTFFADGNWSEINSGKDANHGVWSGAGDNYQLTFEGYTFDAQGKHSGSIQVRAAIELRDSDHLTARWVQDLIDRQGKVTEKAYFGVFTGTRMTVENAGVAPAAALVGSTANTAP